MSYLFIRVEEISQEVSTNSSHSVFKHPFQRSFIFLSKISFHRWSPTVQNRENVSILSPLSFEILLDLWDRQGVKRVFILLNIDLILSKLFIREPLFQDEFPKHRLDYISSI